jgi:hypothetical protein
VAYNIETIVTRGLARLAEIYLLDTELVDSVDVRYDLYPAQAEGVHLAVLGMVNWDAAGSTAEPLIVITTTGDSVDFPRLAARASRAAFRFNAVLSNPARWGIQLTYDDPLEDTATDQTVTLDLVFREIADNKIEWITYTTPEGRSAKTPTRLLCLIQPKIVLSVAF